MRRLVAIVVAAVVVMACSASTAGSSATAESSGLSPQEFASLLQRNAQYDYDPFESPRAQRDAADLVVLGTVTKMQPGRSFPYSGTQLNLVVEVVEVIKGKSDELVYVEVEFGEDEMSATIERSGLDGRVVMFLDDRTDVEADDGMAGRPDGAPIYAPYVQGLIMEADRAWISGLDDSKEWAPSWLELSTFEELIAATKG